MITATLKNKQVKLKSILMIGLGGAGQRHLRIFRELLPKETKFIAFRAKKSTPLLNTDFTVDKTSNIENKYNIQLIDTIDEAFKLKPDLVIISNPTSLHYEVALAASKRGLNIFLEKPFSHTLEGFEKFRTNVLKNNLLFFMSFQRRYHKLIVQINELIKSGRLGKIISVSIQVASYVPNWHPYENFRNLYACKKELGGGVLLTEIHEIDLCYQFFGMPNWVFCSGGNYSNFSLEVEDTVSAILSYPNFNINLSLSFMQQPNRRSINIYGTNAFIESNFETCSLRFKDHDSGEEILHNESNYTNDDMFYAQAKYFLNEFNLSNVEAELNAAYSSMLIVEACKKSIESSKAVSMKQIFS